MAIRPQVKTGCTCHLQGRNRCCVTCLTSSRWCGWWIGTQAQQVPHVWYFGTVCSGSLSVSQPLLRFGSGNVCSQAAQNGGPVPWEWEWGIRPPFVLVPRPNRPSFFPSVPLPEHSCPPWLWLRGTLNQGDGRLQTAGPGTFPLAGKGSWRNPTCPNPDQEDEY